MKKILRYLVTVIGGGIILFLGFILMQLPPYGSYGQIIPNDFGILEIAFQFILVAIMAGIGWITMKLYEKLQ